MASSSRSAKAERQRRIIAELRAHTSVRASRLAAELGVSTETIRRDLDELHRNGLLDRTYGGAAATASGSEPSVNDRYRLHVSARQSVARQAVRLVGNGQLVMIDAGSTTAHVANRLAAERDELVVITNSLGVVTALAVNPTLRVVLCPGDYDRGERSVSGPETLAFVRRFNADVCIIGASGLSAEGPTEANAGSTWVKRVMLERSQRRLLVMDKSKYGLIMPELVCDLDAFDDIVVDAAPPEPLAAAVRASGARLRVATQKDA